MFNSCRFLNKLFENKGKIFEFKRLFLLLCDVIEFFNDFIFSFREFISLFVFIPMLL